ncbi:hypothetical protein CHK_0868 [Christensenella hongkongensis]|uniref:Uncharacterized protein n=1 Tax=Christensenella hongkongensis TaxID=270498 RepID=A0A0M2NL62_9FIRM|nr:hypothetical protein CHK_0868 [Christensenella hongkongensis]
MMVPFLCVKTVRKVYPAAVYKPYHKSIQIVSISKKAVFM